MKVIPEKKSTEKKCELCGSDCNVLADLGNQPLANKYPANKDAFKKEKFWHLKALICSNCFCGQLNEMIDRSEMFEDYYYLSSVNAELNKHVSTGTPAPLKMRIPWFTYRNAANLSAAHTVEAWL